MFHHVNVFLNTLDDVFRLLIKLGTKLVRYYKNTKLSIVQIPK